MAATARPWELSGIDNNYIVRDAGDRPDMPGVPMTQTIAISVSRSDDEGQENARLIVHAVNCHGELLAACRLGLARIESDIESFNHRTREGDALRAAIAKAEAS